jgi:hypothetical protein
VNHIFDFPYFKFVENVGERYSKTDKQTNKQTNKQTFPTGMYTPPAEKCDVEVEVQWNTYYHSVRLFRDLSFGYPEHSNWQ